MDEESSMPLPREDGSGDARPAGGLGAPKLSLVISTLGRSDEIRVFLESLRAQSEQDFELIVVDQNADGRLLPILAEAGLPRPVVHLRRPEVRGLSCGRNLGLAEARGEIVAFPDDDCWYPPWLFERSLALLEERGVDILAGRAADETGRSINGRYAGEATAIDRSNVFETQIEWVVFFRRSALLEMGGFDEEIGTGASTPWQACEGADIVLRGLAKGFTAYFDPSLYGHHLELDIVTPDAAMCRKARGYGRGMGYVMRKHRYGPGFALYRICRPLARLAISALRLNGPRIRYYANVFAGRWEGYLARI